MNSLHVATQPAYQVHFLQQAVIEKLLQQLTSQERVALICDQTVATLYADLLSQLRCRLGGNTVFITVASGEKYKTRTSKERLENQLLQAGFKRDSVLVALGGGVICDLVGFTAATFCRGVPVLYMPTTLLAMVDACVGGKTAVNTPLGKNLIGAFKQPRAVIIDSRFIKTLSLSQRVQGLAEVLKHALLMDADLFTQLLNEWHPLLTAVNRDFLPIIARSCQLKAAVVVHDEQEQGARAILNLGHTVAHALERCSDYTLPHGVAVLLGLYTESYAMALQTGEESIATALASVIQQTPLEWTEVRTLLKEKELFWQALFWDKKNTAGMVQFVRLPRLAAYADPSQSTTFLCHFTKEIMLQTITRLLDLLIRGQ